MAYSKKVLSIIGLLEAEYPSALCSLEYEKDYELLFTVRLAAQCTDERVNKIAPALFERFPTLQAFAAAEASEIQPYIHSCGFFRAKARDIAACARLLIERHGGRVPGTMEELVALPGVGRKTANLILGDIFAVPGSTVVDTHCIRITNRLGLTSEKEPVKIEMRLRDILPPDKSSDFCHRMVLHGRAVCDARRPRCEDCCIRAHCKEYLDKSGQNKKIEIKF